MTNVLRSLQNPKTASIVPGMLCTHKIWIQLPAPPTKLQMSDLYPMMEALDALDVVEVLKDKMIVDMQKEIKRLEEWRGYVE